jgi:Carboxypeptidase regulatory-like domain
MLCRADLDACLGANRTAFRTGTEHLRYMAWFVKNSVGTPIVGATVRLKGTPTAESTTVADGSFSLAALPAGEYKLTIVADGTTATYAQTITLTSDSPAVVITVSNSREIKVARSSRRIRRAARNSQVKR